MAPNLVLASFPPWGSSHRCAVSLRPISTARRPAPLPSGLPFPCFPAPLCTLPLLSCPVSPVSQHCQESSPRPQPHPPKRAPACLPMCVWPSLLSCGPHASPAPACSHALSVNTATVPPPRVQPKGLLPLIPCTCQAQACRLSRGRPHWRLLLCLCVLSVLPPSDLTFPVVLLSAPSVLPQTQPWLFFGGESAGRAPPFGPCHSLLLPVGLTPNSCILSCHPASGPSFQLFYFPSCCSRSQPHHVELLRRATPVSMGTWPVLSPVPGCHAGGPWSLHQVSLRPSFRRKHPRPPHHVCSDSHICASAPSLAAAGLHAPYWDRHGAGRGALLGLHRVTRDLPVDGPRVLPGLGGNAGSLLALGFLQ